MFRLIQSFYIIIVAAARHTKETAHSRHWITILVHVNDLVLYSRPHFLPVNCRKSRSNLFSSFRRLISYVCSATISLCTASLRGRPWGRGDIPAASFACALLYRLTHQTIWRFSSPKCSAISRRVFPASRIAIISGSIVLICVYFLFDMIIPPDVVLSFSYIRGRFVYCPFLLDLFIAPGICLFIQVDRRPTLSFSSSLAGIPARTPAHPWPRRRAGR